MTTTLSILEDMENKFKIISGLNVDMSNITEESLCQVATDKLKSNTYGEVFTPLYLVDQMVDRVIHKYKDTWRVNTIDLCSGYGQFTIRLLRHLTELHKDFDILEYLSQYHYFNEVQYKSIKVIFKIFSRDVNIFIGDARHIPIALERGVKIWGKSKTLGYQEDIRGHIKWNKDYKDWYIREVKYK